MAEAVLSDALRAPTEYCACAIRASQASRSSRSANCWANLRAGANSPAAMCAAMGSLAMGPAAREGAAKYAHRAKPQAVVRIKRKAQCQRRARVIEVAIVLSPCRKMRFQHRVRVF